MQTGSTDKCLFNVAGPGRLPVHEWKSKGHRQRTNTVCVFAAGTVPVHHTQAWGREMAARRVQWDDILSDDAKNDVAATFVAKGTVG